MNQANLTASIPTVEELIERALRGEARACRHLYDRYSRAMYNTAYRLTGNAADAEDMLQEAFAAAFADLKKLGITPSTETSCQIELNVDCERYLLWITHAGKVKITECIFPCIRANNNFYRLS